MDGNPDSNDAPPGKKDLIVAAAHALFLDDGFVTTSMEAIARRAGVSKATLYAHFEGKEALFADVMERVCHQAGGPTLGDLAAAGGPAEVLTGAGRILIERMLAPEGLALLRVVVGGAARFPGVGRVYWAEGPGTMQRYLAGYLADMDRGGRLEVADPELAAKEFVGLVTGTHLVPVLLGVEPPPAPAEIERVLEDVVAGFLAGLKAGS